jgi:hypothetical protein
MLKDNKRLKSLWLGPLRMAYPDGSIPATNDSNPSSLNSFRGHYRWGLDYFREPLFASYAGKEAQAQSGKLQPESAVLKSLGMAALRAGKGEKAVCAFLDYGLHGGGHGHPDKLNLMLYALGGEFLVDPGRISYSVPEFKTWCRTTVAHNTVVIDGRNQNPDNGELDFFEKKKEHTACMATSARAYKGHVLKRFLLLAGYYLVDVFSVQGSEEAQVDWVVHSYGELSTGAVETTPSFAAGKSNGYQHLEDVKQVESGAHIEFELKAKSGKFMRVHCVGDTDTGVLAGKGIGTKLKERVPFILRRRKADSTVFVTVYDMSGDGSSVTRVEILPVKSPDTLKSGEGAGILLQDSGGRKTVVAVDFRARPSGRLCCDGREFEKYLFEQSE